MSARDTQRTIVLLGGGGHRPPPSHRDRYQPMLNVK
jgi:hypothetical protein